MHFLKNKIKLTIYIFLAFSIIFSLIIHVNCNFKKLFNVFIDYNLNYAFYSCKKLSNYKVKNFAKKKISNSFIEKIVRQTNKEQIRKSYTFLNKKNLDIKKTENKFEIPKKTLGIKSNIEPYLKDKKILNNKEQSTWTRSHGGYKNEKYSKSLNPISVDNIKDLTLEWSYESTNSFNKKNFDNVEANPVFHNGIIYSVMGDRKLVALNATNGNLLWKKQGLLTPARRGFLISGEKSNSYIYINIGQAIAKINSRDGSLQKEFGNKGIIYSVNSPTPPIVYKDNLYIVTATKIIVFNKISGELLEEIKIHPNRRFYRGGVVWGGNAFDEEKGYLYVVTGNPRPALIGIDRKGKNKNSNSLVAIDLNKSKIIWTFQDVFHDLWDFDISSPPVISDLRINDKYLESVIISTKTGNTYVIERNTGKSFFDLDFRKTLPSNIPGEISYPYQRKNLLPEQLINIEYEKNSFNKLDKKKQNYIKKILSNSSTGWFHPPELGKKTIIFGLHGGATWMGSAYDPDKQIIFTPVINIPWILKVEGKTLETSIPNDLKNLHKIYVKNCSSCHGKFRNGNFDPESKKNVEVLKDYIPSLIGHSLSLDKNNFKNLYTLDQMQNIHKNLDINQSDLNKIKKLFVDLDKYLIEKNELFLRYYWYKFLDKEDNPASNPPWGEIIALDVITGKIKWRSQTGDKIDNKNNVYKGTPSYGGVSLTSGNILFSTGTDDKKIYGINSDNGKILWDYKMDAAGSAPPIIYNFNGKQYVSVVSTGGLFSEYKEKASKIYTFSLKN